MYTLLDYADKLDEIARDMRKGHEIVPVQAFGKLSSYDWDNDTRMYTESACALGCVFLGRDKRDMLTIRSVRSFLEDTYAFAAGDSNAVIGLPLYFRPPPILDCTDRASITLLYLDDWITHWNDNHKWPVVTIAESLEYCATLLREDRDPVWTSRMSVETNLFKK